MERDVNKDVLFAWSYPSIDSTLQSVLIERTGLANQEAQKVTDPYRWSKFGSVWHYMMTIPVDDKKNPRLTASCLVVLSETFNPEKYQKLLLALLALYKQGGMSTRPLLAAYLKIFRTGKIKGWANDAFDDRRALIASSIKSVVTRFGAGSVLFWMAILLKKRILIYSDNLKDLLSLIRTFPLWAWHRQDWGTLRPLVCLGEAELKDLNDTSVYVAGCTDSRCSSKANYFDLLVDAVSGKVVVPKHAKQGGMLAISQYQKDASDMFLKAAESESDQGIIKVIAKKTKEIIDKVRKIKTKLDVPVLKLSDFGKLNLPPEIVPFLHGVAMAEGMSG